MGCSVGGAPATQTWAALYWYEQLVSRFGIRSVIELGTEKGGLAVFFGLSCPGFVITIDTINQLSDRTGALFGRLGIDHWVCDCRDESVAKKVVAMSPAPRLVFCDNGDKLGEFKLYAPLLHAGDVIAVHDIGTEFMINSETESMVAGYGLTRIDGEEGLGTDSTFAAAWVKR